MSSFQIFFQYPHIESFIFPFPGEQRKTYSYFFQSGRLFIRSSAKGKPLVEKNAKGIYEDSFKVPVCKNFRKSPIRVRSGSFFKFRFYICLTYGFTWWMSVFQMFVFVNTGRQERDVSVTLQGETLMCLKYVPNFETFNRLKRWSVWRHWVQTIVGYFHHTWMCAWDYSSFLGTMGFVAL